MIDPSYEHYIVYNMIEGRRTGRGSGPAGTSKGFWLDNGEAILVLPAEAVQGDLALYITDVRTALWERAKAARDAAIDGGAPTPAGVVDSDALSRSNITGASIGAMLAQSSGAPFSVEWTLKNNSVVTLDAAQMIALGLAVLAHVNACHDHARALREQIEAAADVPALLQIDVSAGWPG